MSDDHPLLDQAPLGFQWGTADPFLFCVHHHDAYPVGNSDLGPAASLAGRDLGMDFTPKDGWRMYHGDVVPGFPQHPHRGFETITIVRRGLIDHSDSLGATARFGAGDVQWLTAGSGIQHAEMFPLVHGDQENPLELFQIWLNLPRASKMVDPHFSMLWRHAIPAVEVLDGEGHATRVTVIAGAYGSVRAPAPPPHSWASRPEAGVAIFTLSLAARARFTLPAATPDVHRVLYWFVGGELSVAGRRVTRPAAPPTGLGVAASTPAALALVVDPTVEIELQAGDAPCELLMLQGRPIGEPVAQQGPFVMNTPGEVRQAFLDYQRTRFGGWPFSSLAPVHARSEGRFARHADGRIERPT